MSWNEPGDRDNDSKKKDPWGRDDQGPPNLDEALRQLQAKLQSLFGGSRPTGGMNGDRSAPAKSGFPLSFWLIGVVLVAGYIAGGIFVVQPAEKAVILRFGSYLETVGPGPHWIPPLIEKREIVNVQEVNTTTHGGKMLTKDENIVSAEIAVQYRVNNAPDYLFNLVSPQKSLKQVSESALRAVVGESTLNEVLTTGRSEISAEVRKQIQEILDNYGSGLYISDLAMQQTKAPEEVRAAFDDAIKAQQDEERLVNESQAYAHKVIPIAQGRAKRTLEEARAYKEQVVLEAKGKTAKFAEILPEYQRAPQVTRDRLYLDSLQDVYSRTSKVLIDVKEGNNLVYLPLDKIIQNPGTPRSSTTVSHSSSGTEYRSEVNAMNRSMTGRPSYENAQRPSREGA